MIKDLLKHTTEELPDIAWRFNEKLYLLEKIKSIDKDTASLIWDKLKEEGFIQPYKLVETKFESFEAIEFADNYAAVTNRLNELPITGGNILLIWFSGLNTVVTDWNTFKENWQDFFYPSSDDLVVISENWDSMIYFAHHELLQIGKKASFD